jgi:hypothetical protein
MQLGISVEIRISSDDYFSEKIRQTTQNVPMERTFKTYKSLLPTKWSYGTENLIFEKLEMKGNLQLN